MLYLDFDGVLHHDAVYRIRGHGILIDQQQAPGRSLFEWSGHLEELLAPYPQICIVLSTSWVKTLRYSRTVRQLSEGLQTRVIGATSHSIFSRSYAYLGGYSATQSRGVEIVADVNRRKPDAWVAVDDDDEGWSAEARQHLVLCDSSTGLGDVETRSKLGGALRRHFG